MNLWGNHDDAPKEDGQAPAAPQGDPGMTPPAGGAPMGGDQGGSMPPAGGAADMGAPKTDDAPADGGMDKPVEGGDMGAAPAPGMGDDKPKDGGMM